MQHIDASSAIVLASESPRRRRLMEQAGLVFTVVPSFMDERRIPVREPESHARHLAEAKARDVSRRYPTDWVIGADTIVVIEGKVLGKPASTMAARLMLRELSGTIHEVLTGFAVRRHIDDHLFSRVVRTEVEFKRLSEEEISWYISTGEPFDKAGAYAIQGIGAFLVRRINGSCTNVVGLPMCELMEYLMARNIVRPGTEATAGVRRSRPCKIA